MTNKYVYQVYVKNLETGLEQPIANRYYATQGAATSVANKCNKYARKVHKVIRSYFVVKFKAQLEQVIWL